LVLELGELPLPGQLDFRRHFFRSRVNPGQSLDELPGQGRRFRPGSL
jgi:hypothetical protein